MNKERAVLFAGMLFLSTELLGCRGGEDLSSLDYNVYDYPNLMNAGALERKRRAMVEELCLERNGENESERFVLKTVNSDLKLCQNALEEGLLTKSHM